MERVVVADGGRASWHDALAPLAADGNDWLWLIEAGVAPRPDALRELLAGLDRTTGLPDPVLLAGRVLGQGGVLDPDSTPSPPLLDREGAISAAERGLAALRLARWGSLLVRRSALAEHGPPSAAFAGGADDVEWTARLLAGRSGYVAPRSVAVRAVPVVRDRRRIARDRLRLTRSPGWVGQERAWWLWLLAGDAARRVRRVSSGANR